MDVDTRRAARSLRLGPGAGLVAATAAGLLAVTGCTVGDDGDRGDTGRQPGGSAQQMRGDDDRPPGYPRRTGPRVLVDSGGAGDDAWTVHAQPSEFGMCIEIRAPERGRELSCDFGVPELRDVGEMALVDGRGSSPLEVVAGPVVDYATTVRLEFATGEPVEVAPAEPKPRSELDFYAADVSGRGPVEAVVALDRAGRLIERLVPPH